MIGFELLGPSILYGDNQGSIYLCANLEHKRSKHIDIRHHWIREVVASGQIKLQWITSASNVADLLTKPLFRLRHETGVAAMGLGDGADDWDE